MGGNGLEAEGEEGRRVDEKTSAIGDPERVGRAAAGRTGTGGVKASCKGAEEREFDEGKAASVF